MKHKFFSLALSASILCCFMSVSAAAVHIERLPESTDYDVVMEEAKADLINSVNDVLAWEDINVTITEDDIDWNECYKRYLDDTDLFASLSSDCSLNDVEQALTYTWVVPISVDGYDISAEIVKGAPLSEAGEEADEETVAAIKESAGHWYSDGIGICKTASAGELESAMSASLDSDAKMLYVSALAKMESPVGFVSDGDSVMVQLLDEPSIVADEITADTNSADSSAQTADQDISVDDAIPELEKNKFYSFEEMAAVMNQYEFTEESSDSVGGASNLTRTSVSYPAFVLPIVCIIAVLGVVFAFIYRKRRKA